jgi:cell division protein ZapA
MSKSIQAVSLSILGKEYRIACAYGEQDTLIRKAQELDKQMRKIRDTGKVAGADRIAVLAALNLTHEAGSDKNQAVSTEFCDRLIDLREKIEKALEN